MSAERSSGLARRAAVHAALADPARLAITDTLLAGGASPPALGRGHTRRVRDDGALLVTVCDMAREELGGRAAVHWSVPARVPAGDPASFDAAVADLSDRVGRLAPRLAATS